MRILVVDDDESVAGVLKDALSLEGYAVDVSLTGEEGEKLAESIPYDLIILDVLLDLQNSPPAKTGFQICRSLRQKKIKTPIMLLTGVFKKDLHQIEGLECGADDYLFKPIRMPVFMARVRALLRRPAGINEPLVYTGKLVMDTVHRQVWLDQLEIKLTPKEYAILEYLARRPDQVVLRSGLEQHAWNIRLDSLSNVVDQHIKNLRKKLGDDVVIETVQGMGYRLRARNDKLR